MFLDSQKPLQNTGLIDEYVAFPLQVSSQKPTNSLKVDMNQIAQM